MGGGRALWMLYVPCPEGLWSLPVMPIRLSPSLSSHTLFGYWPITTTTGILNKWGLAKAWGLDLWFSDGRPTASFKDLWADSSKSMSQQQDFAGPSVISWGRTKNHRQSGSPLGPRCPPPHLTSHSPGQRSFQPSTPLASWPLRWASPCMLLELLESFSLFRANIISWFLPTDLSSTLITVFHVFLQISENTYPCPLHLHFSVL